MKAIFLLVAFVLSTIQMFAERVEVYTEDSTVLSAERYAFVQRGEESLTLDVYKPDGVEGYNKTIIYVFGGGFIRGSKSDNHNVSFYETMLERGFTVVAIDYRLALKGEKGVGILNPKPTFTAVEVASEDLISATAYIIDNHESMGIDTSRIAVIGSSAGALTVLRTDYEMANHSEMVKELPQGFRYKAVVSMAGALLTNHGKVVYKTSPAPTMFFHGTKDKVVFYKGVSLGKMSMKGTYRLARMFKKKGYRYDAYHFVGSQHEVAEFPRHYMTAEICNYLDRALEKDKSINRHFDVRIKDSYSRENFKLKLTLSSLYE